MRLADTKLEAPYELQAIPYASIDDLDLVLFERGYLQAAVAPELLEQNQRSMEDQLKASRFVDRDGAPTVLGLLVIGKDPRAFIGGAYIRTRTVTAGDGETAAADFTFAVTFPGLSDAATITERRRSWFGLWSGTMISSSVATATDG